MEVLKKIVNFFGLNEETWIQHSNPWSVWTRLFILPFLAFAIWSHVWIGSYNLIAIAILLFWTWINPRFFGRPSTTKHWSSRAVFGERVWLRKSEIAIPKDHERTVTVLNIITGSGLPFLIWGLYVLNIWPVLLGLVIVVLGKFWFLDRMVWIYEDMKTESEEYASWEY